MSCPSEDQLLAFAGGYMAPAEASAIEAHIADCEDCSRAVAEGARDLFGSEMAGEAPNQPLESGAQLGRYAILGLLGRGAMGVVYSAYDPKLDRRVALKVLRPDHRLAARQDVLRERLLREGQAMARLSHPNIVAVHDVGTLGDEGVFLAMELVEGETLRHWLDAEPRSWRAVVGVFLEAARGLGAAHQAGLVHRDFKPDNVLVARDGRVRVTDFGLARKEGELPLGAAATSLQSLTLTSTGLVLGTPAYMAPEQLRGEEAGVAADLFSFSSALWQALYRQHPFPTESFEVLRAAVLSGQVREPPAGAAPAFVKRALLRGLRVKPEERFASMDALAAALAADPVRRLRRATLVTLPFVIAAAVVGGTLFSARRTRLLCRAGETRLQAVWGDAKKTALRSAFASVPVVHAAATSGLVERALDDYGRAWTAGYTDACEATQLRGEQSTALLDRRMQCLDDRLRSFDALVDNFGRADSALVDKAVAAVASLPRVESCADRQRLLALTDEPVAPARRATVDAARAGLARARAANLAGRYQDGLPIAHQLVDDERAIGQPVLAAEARFELARLLYGAGQIKEAQAAMVLAMAQGARAGDAELEARASSEMVRLLGFDQKVDEAERWATLAGGEIAHLGNDLRLQATLASNHGMMLTLARRGDDALPYLQQAVALLGKRVDARDLEMATLLDRQGMALYTASHFAEAAKAAEEAVAIFRERLGPDHPDTANAMFNLANPVEALGRRHEALALERQALAIRERNLGPNHREVGLSLNNLASSELALGNCKQGATDLERAEAITKAIYGADHPEMITVYAFKAQLLGCLGHYDEALTAIRRAEQLVNQHMGAENPAASFTKVIEGALLEANERYDEAYAAYDRSIQILSKASPNHTDLAAMLDGKGRVLRRRGQLAEAEALHQRALALDETIGHDVPDLIPTLMALADVERAQKHGAKAVAFAERALAIAEKAEIAPLLLAEARLTLAVALEAAGEKTARAQQLWAQARADIVASPYTSPELLRRTRATRTN